MPLETLLLIVAFVFGCVWGSFFNVVVYRLPRQMSVVKPGSHCFACNAPIAWYDNIPLVSWLVLRGKCRHCGAPFSFRYFVVELISGLLFLFVMMKYVGPIVTKGRTLEGIVALVLHWLMVGGFVVLTFIDFDHKIIPDCVSLPGIVLGLIASFAVPDLVARYRGQVAPEHVSHLKSLLEGGIGMLVGGGSLWLIAVVGRAVFKKEAMGGGDIKLMAMIGAYMGWQLVLLTVLLSALSGTIVGVALMITDRVRARRLLEPLHETADNDPDPKARAEAKKQIEEIEAGQTGWSSQIPYGPFIVLGALAAFFFGPQIFTWYFGLFARPGIITPACSILSTLL
jgi:leader peptidase (prepilin peptidase)/N-methyltransferase